MAGGAAPPTAIVRRIAGGTQARVRMMPGSTWRLDHLRKILTSKLRSTMPRMTDRSAVRALLETDRAWAVYPLGDLAPGYFDKCEWLGTTRDRPGLILLYCGFTSPIFFALGEPYVVRRLLDEIDDEQQMNLHVPPNIVPLLRSRYHIQ